MVLQVVQLKRKKSNLLPVLLVAAVILLSNIVWLEMYIQDNLRTHSVHYAHHMEHREGIYPEIIFLEENFGHRV